MKINIHLGNRPSKLQINIGLAFVGPEPVPEEAPATSPDLDLDLEPVPAPGTTPQSPARRSKRKTPPPSKSWWDDMSSDEQDAYLERHPGSKRRKTVTKGAVKTVVMLKLNEVHSKAKALGKDYRFGMKGIRAMREGKPVSPAQKQGMKRTAGLVGSLLLVALVGAALFTPLGGLAMDMGSDYLEYLKEQQSPESSKPDAGAEDAETESSPVVGDTSAEARESDPDRDTLDEFQAGMTAWFAALDVQAIIDNYKAKGN